MTAALFAVGACTRVIGLSDDYYVVPADAGSAGSGLGGSTGTGGDLASAGQAGAVSEPLCADHPITQKSTWIPTGSSAQDISPVSNTTDNSPARWSTGKPQSGNEWLRVDFGATVSLRTLNLQQSSNSDSNDYPRMYAVYLSDTDQDTTASPYATGVGTNGVSTGIELPKVVTGRYLLIKQLGASLSWWSVDELEVSCTDD